MGKIKLLEIYVEKSDRIYSAGELVKGNLMISLGERLKISKLEVSLNGHGRVTWTSKQLRTYSDAEDYIKSNVVLFKEQDGNDCYLEAGEQLFPFQIQLPQNIPASFEHANVLVEYYLKGKVDTLDDTFYIDAEERAKYSAAKIASIEIETYKTVFLTLTITKAIDSLLRQPVTDTRIKTICNCCCCKTGSIIVQLSIPKSVYVPGELFYFNASIDNKSAYEIKRVSLKIMEYILCVTRSGSKMFKEQQVTEVVWKNKIIRKQTHEEWTNVSIIIPLNICPSSKGTIFDIYHCAILHLNPGGTFASIPIVI